MATQAEAIPAEVSPAAGAPAADTRAEVSPAAVLDRAAAWAGVRADQEDQVVRADRQADRRRDGGSGVLSAMADMDTAADAADA